ncbi:Polymer-forming cytoskeletal, partial [Globisporangium splendens]
MDDGVAIPHNAPPKPKRANPPSSLAEPDDGYSDTEYSISPARRGRLNNHHSTRQTKQLESDSPPMTPAYAPVRTSKVPIIDAEPETTIGVAVRMKGELSFERLLRIEGEFEGKLVSKGSLVVGTKGVLIGSIENMKEVYVTGGKIIGNLVVEKLVLRDKAQIFGNITVKTVKIEPDCVVIGRLNINPQAPELINEKGEIVQVLKKEKSAAAV